MRRAIYACLLRLHPKPFREKFAEEMQWIFDQDSGDLSRERLLLDAAVSLVRQRFLRANPNSKALAAASIRIQPFHSLEDDAPPTATLVHGAFASLLLFAVVGFIATHGGANIPSGLFTRFYSSSEPIDQEEIKQTSKQRDSWREFARHYFTKVRVLKILDTDGDLALSPGEIATAPTVLRWLDEDHDGTLNPIECGSAPSQGEFFMRVNPVLAVLDANRSGMISRYEIHFSVGALKSLDRNRDGHLTIEEVAPRR